MSTREFYIAGVQHHKSHLILDQIKVGQKIEMVPEPTNKFDSNAVSLQLLGEESLTMLGYVPAKFSPEVSAKLQIHDNLECTIIEFNKDGKPWERIKVSIGRGKDAD